MVATALGVIIPEGFAALSEASEGAHAHVASAGDEEPPVLRWGDEVEKVVCLCATTLPAGADGWPHCLCGFVHFNLWHNPGAALIAGFLIMLLLDNCQHSWPYQAKQQIRSATLGWLRCYATGTCMACTLSVCSWIAFHCDLFSSKLWMCLQKLSHMLMPANQLLCPPQLQGSFCF